MVKIAFIGTHGVGKTTLCYDLAAVAEAPGVNVDMVKEVARLSPLPINRKTSLDAQTWILTTQIAEEIRSSAHHEVVVCDRSVLDNYAYMLLACGRQKAIERFVDYWMKTYDLLFKVPISGQAAADGVRDTDEFFMRPIDQLVDTLLAEKKVPFERLPDDSRRRGSTSWATACSGCRPWPDGSSLREAGPHAARPPVSGGRGIRCRGRRRPWRSPQLQNQSRWLAARPTAHAGPRAAAVPPRRSRMADDKKPFVPAEESLPELTLKALLLGVAVAALLGAANAYLGFKAGQTVAATFPAAVLAIAAFRLPLLPRQRARAEHDAHGRVGGRGAGRGRDLHGAAFVMVNVDGRRLWTGFNYWQTSLILVVGGLLGILFIILLRRTLVVDAGLPFPESRACAEIVKTGEQGDTGARYVFGAMDSGCWSRCSRTRPASGSSARASTSCGSSRPR